jgi:tetratricopeptide (TPR) repeat protein
MFKRFTLLLITAVCFLSSHAQTTAKEWYDKGNTLTNDQKYTEAIAAFKKAAALKPGYAEALHQLAWCYNEQGYYKEAIDALQKEVSAGTADMASNNFEMGYAYCQLAQYSDALRYLNKAIALDDKYALAYKQRGTVYFMSKQYSKVLDDFNKYETYIGKAITDPEYYYRKGWTQVNEGQYADAVPALKRAVELDDRFTNAFSELGYTSYKLQLNDDALQNYRAAMALDNKDSYPLLGTADVYYDNLKQYDSAMRYYEMGTAIQKQNKIAFYKLGWCYNDKDRYAEAIAPLKEAVLLDPEYTEARNELGYAYYKLDKYDEALAQFRLIMNKDAKNVLSRYYAGFCYYLKNDQDNLKKMIGELKALNSTKYVETLTKYVK